MISYQVMNVSNERLGEQKNFSSKQTILHCIIVGDTDISTRRLKIQVLSFPYACTYKITHYGIEVYLDLQQDLPLQELKITDNR